MNCPITYTFPFNEAEKKIKQHPVKFSVDLIPSKNSTSIVNTDMILDTDTLTLCYVAAECHDL